MGKLNLQQVQKCLLNVGLEFHRICGENNIPYYMIGGTMLGAVRHKGFIPWDDDIDFAIPRTYFESFVEACKDLKEPYSLQERVKGNHVHPFLKIEDRSTYAEDSVTLRFGNKIGVTVDVFFLDDCSSDKEKVKPFMKRKRMLDNIGTALFSQPHQDSLTAKIGTSVIRVLLCWVTPQRWISWYNKLEKDINKTGDDAMMSVSSDYGVKEVIPKSIWGKPTLYEFEGHQLYGPEDYDGYLTCLFRNYMQLPPEKERVAHCDGYYAK